MNDNELSTMVRESVTDVHSATPIAQIISRGRAVRARRRTPALAGAGAVLAGSALAVSMLMPSVHPGAANSRHPGSPLAQARLAAWTMHKRANGSIDVTINELRNPVGLQAALQAAGVPVRVSYSSLPVPATRQDGGISVTTGYNGWNLAPPALRKDGQAPKLACKFYAMNNNALNAAFQFPNDGQHGDSVFLVFKPSVLPAGAGLAIFLGGSIDDIKQPNGVPPGTSGGFTVQQGATLKDGTVVPPKWSFGVTPVYASRQCTG
jgi:hypothetical protein